MLPSVKIKEEFQKEINFPICKVELDLDNVASASLGATITATSEYSTYVDDYVIDGDKTHKDNHYWQSDNQSDGSGDFASPEYVEINFGQTRRINRIKIYSYPKVTLTDDEEDGLKKFTIEYNTEASGGSWYAWTGLEDVGGGEGTCVIASGVVTVNTKHLNIFQDDDGISCRRIRLKIEKTQSVSDRARLCEVEVYRTIQLQDETEIVITDLETGSITRMGQNRIQMVEVDRRKDWEFHRFQGARLNLSLLNYDKKLSPDYSPTYDEVTNKGYFNDDIRPELPVRVWLGFDMLGYQEFVPAGEFYIKTWNTDPMTKIVNVIAKDKVLWMKDKLVEIGSTILENKYVEYLIEWISLRCNISADEMNLDDTIQEILYFFPQNKMSWKTCQELTESLGDAGLLFNEYGGLRYECYGQIPREWEQTTDEDWNAGTPNNITVEAGSFKPTITNWIETTTADFNAGVIKDKVDVSNDEIKLLVGAEELNQQQISVPSQIQLSEHYYQSFKLTKAGNVTKVEVYVRNTSSTLNVDLKVAILNDNNNVPGSTKLSEGSVNVAPSFVGWKSLTWASAEIFAKDGRYWIDIETNNYLNIYYDSTNPYSRGNVYGHSGWDLGFKVWITPFEAGHFRSQEKTITSGSAFGRFYASYLSDSVSYVFQVRKYSDGAWSDWVTVSDGGNINLSPGDKVQYDIVLDINGEVNPIVYDVKNEYVAGGQADLLSQQKDCTNKISSWDKLEVLQTLNGKTIIWKTTVSVNGTDWDAEVEVDGNFMIQSAVKQYIKAHSYLETDDGTLLPTGHSFILKYYTETGTKPPTETSFNFHYDGALLGIKQTLSNEAGGKCQVYKKAIVKANPYYKHDYEKVWEGDVPFTVNDGQEIIYYCELNNPCAPNTTGSDQMKLWVNGAYRDADGDGTDTSIGNLTITISRHPTIAFVKFVASGGNVEITSFWIDAKPFKQTGVIQAIAEASQLNQERYRGNDFTYENNYLYVKAIAEIIATTIIENYQKPTPRITQDVPVRYCPQVQIMDRVNIRELNSGINQDYQIFGYKHKLVASRNSFKAETFIQAKEL